MSLTKEECLRILESIALNYDAEYVNECHDDFCISMRNNIKQIKNLIEEHFDNPPLKFEELKPNMWVWDNVYKDYVKLKRHDIENFGKLIIFSKGFGEEYLRKFEENSFFRYEVKEDE